MTEHAHAASFQFWYRTGIVLLLSAVLTLSGTVASWVHAGNAEQNARQLHTDVDLQIVKLQLSELNLKMSDIPQMRIDIGELRTTQDDLKRRVELQENRRSIAP